MTLDDARVLVTGASGFLGTALLPRLAAAGARVDAVARAPRAAAPGVAWHAVDLEDSAATLDLVARTRPQLVFHLASRVTGARGVENVVPLFHANAATTVHLLAALAATGGCRRVVLAGSMEEPSESSLPPSSPYAAAKAAASLYARLFHALYELPVVVARIFMVYGPGQRDGTKLVPYTIRALLAGVAPRLASGRREVDWIHVDDVARGLAALAGAPGIEGRTLDLGSGERQSVRRVVERLHAAIGGPRPEFGALSDRALEVEPVADVEATARACGFRPRIGLDDGLAGTIAWVRAELARENAG
jgi:nucleoside-diphosphate-sugar epimerase